MDYQYTMNDDTAYGIYNGISETKISDYVYTKAKELGLQYGEYKVEKIKDILNKDPEIRAIADAGYTPFPVNEHWSEEYKRITFELIEKRKAPGYANIPAEKVHAVIDRELETAYQTIAIPRMQKEQEQQRKRQQALEYFASVETTEKTIYDEGGKTKQYTHILTTKEGKVFSFTDRNVFDFGRVINPAYEVVPGKKGGIILSYQETLAFFDKFPDKDTVPLRLLDKDEIAAYKLVVKFLGFAGSRFRM